MAKALTLFWLLAMSIAQAGYEAKLSIDQLISQSDIVVVGKLQGVKEWIADGVAHGKGVIEISDTLEGKVPDSEKVTLRWANRLYRSGALEFSDTGETEFVWLLWRAQDGTYRARHSGCQIPLAEKAAILVAIQKRKAEQGSAGQLATRSESDSEGGDKPQPESEGRSRQRVPGFRRSASKFPNHMPTYLHSDSDDYGVTKPVIFWQQKVAVLTPSPNGPIVFGGPLPKGGNLDGAILHSVFSIPIRAIPSFKKLQIESLPLVFPFRHDGGRAEYTVAQDGSVDGLEVEPPQPEDGWPYPEYPQAFAIVRYECSEFEPLNEEESLRLLHQDPGADADRDILIIIPSKSNDPSLPVNLWNNPQDEDCVQCVFIFNTETNEVAAFNDVD